MSQDNGTEEQVKAGVKLIDPKSFMAIAADVVIRTPDRPAMVMHRQAVLVFSDRSGNEYVIPMAVAAAAHVNSELGQAVMDAQSLGDDELEEVELTFGGE